MVDEIRGRLVHSLRRTTVLSILLASVCSERGVELRGIYGGSTTIGWVVSLSWIDSKIRWPWRIRRDERLVWRHVLLTKVIRAWKRRN
jgi:hypothetical protein